MWDMNSQVFLYKWLADWADIVSLRRRPSFTPQEGFWYSHLLKLDSTPRKIMRFEGLNQIKIILPYTFMCFQKSTNLMFSFYFHISYMFLSFYSLWCGRYNSKSTWWIVQIMGYFVIQFSPFSDTLSLLQTMFSKSSYQMYPFFYIYFTALHVSVLGPSTYDIKVA
jgi:hypothetical protein